jgi:hypothetical protein
MKLGTYRPALGAFACAIALAGCSAANGTPSLQGVSAAALDPASMVVAKPGSAALPAARLDALESGPPKSGLVYASTAVDAGLIDVYRENRKQLYRQYTDIFDPWGLAIDSAGNIYAAAFTGGVVDVFKPRDISPYRVLDDSGNTPIGVAVDAGGTVYVANIEPGNITVYAPGQTEPEETLTNDVLEAPFFLAVDEAGDIFVDGLECHEPCSGPQPVIVGEYPAGSTQMTQLNIDIGFPGGVAIDQKGDLLIDDQETSQHRSQLDVFPPGKTKPSITFPLGTYSVDITTFALNPGEQSLYVANYTQGYVQELSYPHGKLLHTIDVGQPLNVQGVAVSPADIP